MSAPIRSLRDIDGGEVIVGDGDRWTLLSFLRYASCPTCLLHVRELVLKHALLAAAGVDVAVVFHSPARRIRLHTRRLAVPFRVIADPDRTLYRQFDVRSSWPKLFASIVHRSFVPAYVKALAFGFWGGAVDGEFARMPADFLIDGRGEIVHVHYGRHIGDHVRMDDVIARRSRGLRATGGVV